MQEETDKNKDAEPAKDIDSKQKNDKSLVNFELKINDLFGIEKATDKLVKASENVLKSVEKGVGKLSKPLMTIIESTAEAKGLRIKEQAYQKTIRERIALFKEASELQEHQQIDELIERTVIKHLDDLCVKQQNKEKVAGFMFKELPFVIEHGGVEIEDAAEIIEDDWLELFWQTASSKSNEDMQRIFARILAGECVKPGSFSPRLLHILSIMTATEAKQFETVCSFSLSDGDNARIIEPIDEFDNFLYEEFEKHPQVDIYLLDDLQSLGLMGQQSIAVFSENDNGLQVDIGGTLCEVSVFDKETLTQNQDYITSILFTKAGEELRQLVFFEPNQPYKHSLQKFVKEYMGMEINEV